ncbi:MAG: PIN domain-containing protein [Amphiplicatus sp.]
MSDAFLDSNILVYAFTDDPRSERALALIEQGPLIGVQTLNEFANVARRKLAMSWKEVGDALAAVRALCPQAIPVTLDVHERALALAGRYGFSFYDALVAAAALAGGCRTLWSEDMQHGLKVERRLKIVNPFLET